MLREESSGSHAGAWQASAASFHVHLHHEGQQRAANGMPRSLVHRSRPAPLPGCRPILRRYGAPSLPTASCYTSTPRSYLSMDDCFDLHDRTAALTFRHAKSSCAAALQAYIISKTSHDSSGANHRARDGGMDSFSALPETPVSPKCYVSSGWKRPSLIWSKTMDRAHNTSTESQ